MFIFNWPYNDNIFHNSYDLLMFPSNTFVQVPNAYCVKCLQINKLRLVEANFLKDRLARKRNFWRTRNWLQLFHIQREYSLSWMKLSAPSANFVDKTHDHSLCKLNKATTFCLSYCLICKMFNVHFNTKLLNKLFSIKYYFGLCLWNNRWL